MADRLKVWRAGDVRISPACCTSAYCGKVECGGCRNEPTKLAWDAWKKAAKAVKEDPVWCPTAWTATVGSAG